MAFLGSDLFYYNEWSGFAFGFGMIRNANGEYVLMVVATATVHQMPMVAGVGVIERSAKTGWIPGAAKLWRNCSIWQPSADRQCGRMRRLAPEGSMDQVQSTNDDQLMINGDSQFVVNAVSKQWMVKTPHLKPVWTSIQRNLAEFKFGWQIRYMSREVNCAADALADTGVNR